MVGSFKGTLTQTSVYPATVVAEAVRVPGAAAIWFSHNHLSGSDGVLNNLRHCAYDGIAEWQAKHKAASLSHNTVKILKDKLLRVPFEIEMNASGAE